MICSECNQRPATLHFSKTINGNKEEFHLCEQCARENGDIFLMNGTPSFTINNLLAGLLNIEPSFQQIKENTVQREQVLQCKECGMTFSQFRKIGRLGCPHCYDTFKMHLQPVFKRLHGGVEHKGKAPERIGGHLLIKKNIENLREQLKELIKNEEFEKAAIVRDEIKQKEQKLASFAEGGDENVH